MLPNRHFVVSVEGCCGGALVKQLSRQPSGSDPLQIQLRQWQAARTWARLIREAESLWRVDVRALHRLAAQELGQLQGEVPDILRPQVNRWLHRFGVATRLYGRPGQSQAPLPEPDKKVGAP